MTRLLAALAILAALAAGLGQASAADLRAPRPDSGGPGVPPVPGVVLRDFEAPSQPYGPGHRGVALQAEPAEAVRAALAGRVTFAGQVARVGWVTVDHGGGLQTTYGPLDPRLVGEGDAVGRGLVLGRLAADAGHLHWGARLHGAYIDPLLLLGRWEVHLVDHRG